MTTHKHEDRKPLDLAAMRQRLVGKTGKTYWRSLNELANSEEFEETVRQEFPRQAILLGDLNRRDFLKVLGASLALAGLTACVPQSTELILPYVKPPDPLVPGKPLFFASTMVQDGVGKGVLIKTDMGRPIKVEGNPQHPDSQGTTDIFMQASLLELYDPDRAKQVLNQGAPKSWQDFTGALGGMLGNGAGLRVLSGPVSSPSLADQMTALLTKFPQAKWYQYHQVGRGNSQAGANQAFGQAFEPVYNFAKADVVLSLDSDFLFSEPGHLRYSRDFTQRHQPISASGTMNRLYVVESSYTITGAMADHRLAIKPSQVEAFARALAGRLGVNAAAPSGEAPGQDWLEPLAGDLQKAGAAALVVAGERQPAAVHALAYAMNQALGAIGNTVTLLPAATQTPVNPYADLKVLVDELNGGQVETLVILDGNPVYSAPADIDFGAAMQKARQSIYQGLYVDETAALSTWFIPAAHYMEMWGDARAFDGTPSLIQPVIEPLYGGKSANELVAALAGQPNAKGYDLVRAYWQGQVQGGSFDNDWRAALSKGVLPNNAGQPAGGMPQVSENAVSSAAAAGAAAGELEIVFEPDYTVWDGRFSNNAWLQELPKPISKLTWDNAAFFSPLTADRLGLKDGDGIAIQLRDRSVEAPAYIIPGQADDVVVVSLGYGRKAGGNVLAGAGFNANAIRTSQAPWFDAGAEIRKTGRTWPLASVRDHWSMENRELIHEATLEEYNANPNFAHGSSEGHELKPPTMYGEFANNGYAWGMAINMNACIGCNACIVACQSENNIPTVGKDQVMRGREMHWLRIDRYYHGTGNRPRFAAFQPVPCMHCEKAPCEPVCPVEATSHSDEGINEMTYNRCVGTRYCSNNCPYKVRRFNFYKYVDDQTESLRAMRNPEVSVRSRGVMEKCTYCVQRVNNARIQSEVEGRQIEDGEVRTACQQACPTNAIVFGNINDENSAVSKLKELPLNYGLLEELGTQPRTTYLAKVRNPNPMIKEEQA